MTNRSDSLNALISICRRKLFISYFASLECAEISKLFILDRIDRIDWMFMLLHQIPEESDEIQFAFEEKSLCMSYQRKVLNSILVGSLKFMYNFRESGLFILLFLRNERI